MHPYRIASNKRMVDDDLWNDKPLNAATRSNCGNPMSLVPPALKQETIALQSTTGNTTLDSCVYVSLKVRRKRNWNVTAIATALGAIFLNRRTMPKSGDICVILSTGNLHTEPNGGATLMECSTLKSNVKSSTTNTLHIL